jgi:replicative DNA helicase
MVENQLVFEAMEALAARKSVMDPITILGQLGSRVGRLPGGMAYLMALGGAVATAEGLPHYLAIVARGGAIRRLQGVCAQAATLVAEDAEEASKLLLEGQRLAAEIVRGRSRPGVDVGEVLPAVLEDLEQRAKNRGTLIGVSTGLSRLDYLTGGLQDEQLVVLAAQTSLGKTALACQMAVQAAVDRKIPVLYFSLEMSPKQLVERFLSRQARINSRDLRTGQIGYEDWKRLQSASGPLSEAPLTLSGQRQLPRLLAEARGFRVKHRGRILIVVDYLQLARAEAKSREREVAEVTGALKELASDLKCPVLAMSQLNRAAEDDDPTLKNLRESGSIEQDADSVFFLIGSREKTVTDARLNVAKQRNGELGDVPLTWIREHYMYTDEARPSRYANGGSGTRPYGWGPDSRLPDDG